MKAAGNGDVGVCARNLLAIVRGEVPFDRLRGLDARIVDRPERDGTDEAVQDAEWVLRTYEPRMDLDSVTVTRDDGGDFELTAKIT